MCDPVRAGALFSVEAQIITICRADGCRILNAEDGSGEGHPAPFLTISDSRKFISADLSGIAAIRDVAAGKTVLSADIRDTLASDNPIPELTERQMVRSHRDRPQEAPPER